MTVQQWTNKEKAKRISEENIERKRFFGRMEGEDNYFYSQKRYAI